MKHIYEVFYASQMNFNSFKFLVDRDLPNLYGHENHQEIYRVGAYLAENCSCKPKDDLDPIVWRGCQQLVTSGN